MKFTVYSKPACPFCEQAKSLLDSKGLAYSVIHLDVGQPKEADAVYITRDELLAKLPGVRTMPQICVESANSAQHIGGFNELQRYIKDRL